MVSNYLLDGYPLWFVYLLTAGLLIAALEIGFYAGKWIQQRRPDQSEPGVGTTVGAALALLGFLMSFITGMSVNLFNQRRALIVQEANAIGTAYLQAAFLGEPGASDSRALYREYVVLRQVTRRDQAQAAVERSEQIHDELWAMAEPVANERSTPIVGIYINSLIHVIDTHAERIDAEIGFRLPPDILFGLYGVALLTMLLVGLFNSYRKDQNGFAMLILVLILSLVFLLIVDLDRPYAGIIQVPQQALIDLQRQIAPTP